MGFNEAKNEEHIFDIENYVLLGEITEDTPMGRWSVGYYPLRRGWTVVYTEATEIAYAKDHSEYSKSVGKAIPIGSKFSAKIK